MFRQYILPVLLAAGFTAALAPPAIRAGRLLGAVDKPGGRRRHGRPTPRLGGLAVCGGFILASFFFAVPFGTRVGFIAAGLAAFLLGLLDDLFALKPGLKLLGQILAAALLPLFGVSIRFVTNPWGGMFELGALAAPATILWVVFLMNTINLIDGLDGLAAGISAIAAASLLFLPQCTGEPFVALLCLLTIGCALGFLPFNFHPARTFMGDGGAHFFGMVLGYITVAGALKGRAALTLSVPVLALAVPFADTALAVTRRWYHRQPLFAADYDHLHHRLLGMGLNQRQTVLLLYGCSVIFGVGTNFLARLAARLGAVILAGLVAGAVLGLSRLNSTEITRR